jgi:hypothetical protein
MKDCYKQPENDYGAKASPLRQGEISSCLDRIEKELQVQYELITHLRDKIDPIICAEYPCCPSDDECSVSGETPIGSILFMILSKILDRNSLIENLADRVRI